MDVPVVVTFAGCPGDSDQATHPNWVTTAVAAGILEVLDWPVGEKAIPVLDRRTRYAADNGVKVESSPPGIPRLQRRDDAELRARVREEPGHQLRSEPFFWQGVDRAGGHQGPR